VWIFAGYKKPLETLFEHNEGLPSRFPLRIVFEDYSNDELQKIFEDMMVYLPPHVVKKNKPKPKTTKVKPTSYSRNTSYNRYNRYPPMFPPSAGETKICTFGMTWTYVDYSGKKALYESVSDPCHASLMPQLSRSHVMQTLGWTDKYGNRTVDPDRVGTQSSKLVDENGDMWTKDDTEWKCSNGQTQEHYPSSPAPIKETKRLLRPTPFHCDEQHLDMAIKRLGRRRGDRGFGNARAIRVLFETIRDCQYLRIARERSQSSSKVDIFLLTRQDLLGPDVTSDSLKKSQAWKDLDELEGITLVKEQVGQLFHLVLRNADREKRGEEPLTVSLNR
jgi:hypothetical protein